MTTIEIIAMIATGVLCVLCIICVVALSSSKKQATENKKAIKDIGDSLGTFSESINQKTDQLIERLDKQQADEESVRRLEALEEEIRQLTAAEEEIANAVNAAEANAAAEAIGEIGEIEELGDEIELDDLFRELQQAEPVIQPEPAQTVQPEPAPVPQPEPATVQPVEEPRKVTRYHQGYNIGRSGRKYTAEELNVLIRE